MAHTERNGNRKTRDQISKLRKPELGYYLIVTDTEETEQNYIYGLRDSMPEELRRKLVIKVIETKTKDLVEEAERAALSNPQFGEPWIIFDRDKVRDFDEIIRRAENRGIRVGWSNPCIEVWFNAYFGKMPANQDSASCCGDFKKAFMKATGQNYSKSDKGIYQKLYSCGDEENAIKLAQRKLEEHEKNYDKPSEMCPCTTIHNLVKEIKDKTK